MKKRVLYCIVLSVLIAFIGFMWTDLLKSQHYETPEKAFFVQKLKGSKLVDVIEDQDVALLIEQKWDGVFSDHVIFQNEKGWSALKAMPHFDHVFDEQWSIRYAQVQGKYVMVLILLHTETPSVQDSLGSDVTVRTYVDTEDITMRYGLIVVDGDLPEDYALYINGQKIILN